MKIFKTSEYFEKLKIQSVNVNDLSFTYTYKYFPKTKEDLIDIISRRMKKEGNACDLNDIDVSAIKDMSWLFNDSDFNGDISRWNVSNVVDMGCMFKYAKHFNCDISSWDVRNVKDMFSMFEGAESFDQDLSGWDITNASDTRRMFIYCPINHQILKHPHAKL